MKRLIIFLLFLTVFLSGCSSLNTQAKIQRGSAGNNPPSGREIERDKNTAIGRVTAVNGTEITLATGTIRGPEENSSNQRTPPTDQSGSRPDRSNSEMDGSRQAPPAKEEGQPHPEGNPPDDMGGTFEEDGASLTIIIDEEEMIQNGFLSDLKIDCLLRISYDEEETIKAIFILNKQQSGPQDEIDQIGRAHV